jgi:hypothetical protein
MDHLSHNGRTRRWPHAGARAKPRETRASRLGAHLGDAGLQAIGVELKLTLELGAARVGHRAEWTRAETALAVLAVIDPTETSAAVMRAAGDSFRRSVNSRMSIASVLKPA